MGHCLNSLILNKKESMKVFYFFPVASCFLIRNYLVIEYREDREVQFFAKHLFLPLNKQTLVGATLVIYCGAESCSLESSARPSEFSLRVHYGSL